MYLLFLIALFEGGLRLFGRMIASLLLLLVATRVIFFVQSSFVYPEIMLAFFTFLSFYFYSRDQLLLTSLALFMLFFTKEGGLVFGAVMGVDAMVALFRRQETIKRRLLRLAAVLAPACLIGLFFIIQKAKLGWYVLPEHSGMIKTKWDDYYFMLRRGIYWTFRGDHAMDILVLFIILLSLIPALRLKNARYLFLLPPAVIVWRLADGNATNLCDSQAWVALFLLCFTIPVWCILSLNKAMSAPARKFILLSGTGVFLFLFYSSLTEIGYRYLLAAIVLILIFMAVSIGTCITAVAGLSNRLFYVAAGGIILIGAYGFYPNDRTEDAQLGAFHTMNVELHNIAFLEKENAFDKEIAVGCSWEHEWLTDTLHGFLSSGRTFTHTKRLPVGPQTEYAVFGNACGERDDYRLILTDPGFHLVYKTKTGKIWAEIYKRN